MVLKRRETGGCLAVDLEGRDAVCDSLVGLGEDIEDRLAQPGQRRAFRLLQSIQVPVDFQGRHGPILLTCQPQQQGPLRSVAGVPVHEVPYPPLWGRPAWI